MTSNYVMVSIKLFHDVGNDQFIILCNFSGRILIWKPTFIEYFFNHNSTSPSKELIYGCVKTDATTPNIVGPTMLGPAVHRGKDTTHKAL